MKTYEEIRNSINESESTAGGGFGDGGNYTTKGRSAYSDYGIHYTENDSQLKRINAMVNAFTQKEYLEPRGAISVLRTKLNLTGLDFPFDNSVEIKTNENVTYRLLKFGGTFGKTPSTPFDQFEETDGFADDKSYVLSLNVVDNPNGLYRIEAVVKEGESADIDVDNARDSLKITSGANQPPAKGETEIQSFLKFKK